MFVIFSTGKIVNLSHVAIIDSFTHGSLKMRLANGQYDIVSGATPDDYEAVLEAIKGANDSSDRTTPNQTRAQPRARAVVS